jgi:hypothetical protein
MTSYPVVIITLILAFIPVSAILSAAWFLYDWLISRLPRNVQAVLITHQDQVRRIITSVVDAVEQQMQGEDGADKKAEAIDKAKAIFENLPLPKSIPQPSDELIDTLIEQAVAYLPKDAKPLPVEPAKPASTTNTFTDPTPTVPLPYVGVTGIPPVVTWNSTRPSPLVPALDPPPAIPDAL